MILGFTPWDPMPVGTFHTSVQISGRTGSAPSILRYLKPMAQAMQPTQELKYLVAGAEDFHKNLCPFFPEVIMDPALLIILYFLIQELTVMKHLFCVIPEMIGNPPCFGMDL